jgi:GMP reductase
MIKFDLNDVLIEPTSSSDIRSRSEVNPFCEDGFLPLFAAPMDTVVDNTNYLLYNKLKINVCLPRGVRGIASQKNVFISVSLNEFDNEFLNHPFSVEYKRYILIDIANGHMKALCESVKTAKDFYGDELILMVGNIANSQAYINLSNAGADYIRVGIGNGAGCLTTENTAIGYPIGSLIKECYNESLSLKKPAKIVADGGMKGYSDIIKSLALGADYVMLGSVFNKSLESCGDTFLFNKIKINPSSWFAGLLFDKGFTLTKKYRGMSSKEVQKKWGHENLKTSEGVVRFRPVEYKMGKWVENLVDYLKSSMSYSGAKNLEEYVGNPKYNLITENSFKRFNK